VRRHSTGHPHNFGIELEFQIATHERARFGFEIAARKPRGFVVRREHLEIVNPANGEVVAHYDITEGEVVASQPSPVPPATGDRLYLLAASSLPAFRPAYDALRSMGFYNLNPEAMKQLQSPDAGDLLHRDGANIASVIARLKADSPSAMKRIDDYLNAIVPGVREVDRHALGPKETLRFRQSVQGSSHPWNFYAVSMSDGTLRALGALVAVSQLTDGARPVRLVGIEEPETALHPSAAGALMDALREASEHTQILVTTHSPDLLDQLDPERDGLLVVVARDGTTSLAQLDEPGRTALTDHLYTAGELHRMGQLQPDESEIQRQTDLPLFEGEGRR
jgi:hypothetical protein